MAGGGKANKRVGRKAASLSVQHLFRKNTKYDNNNAGNTHIFTYAAHAFLCFVFLKLCFVSSQQGQVLRQVQAMEKVPAVAEAGGNDRDVQGKIGRRAC